MNLSPIYSETFPAGLSSIIDTCAETLVDLFQRTVECFLGAPRALSEREITVGGVQNVGNTCIFSVLLQELAALPDVYDFFFESTRIPSVQYLKDAIQKIRSGQLVTRDEIKQIGAMLQENGWQGKVSTFWSIFLHRLAPCIFDEPVYDVFDLYETTLNLLTRNIKTGPMRIVLLGAREKIDANFFSLSEKLNLPVLWRIVCHEPVEYVPRFVVQNQIFELKLVHVLHETLFGKHVSIYRKDSSGWIHCNDDRVTAAQAPLATGVFQLVYQSRPISS